VSLIPFLDPLRENIRGKMGVEGLVAINSPRVSEEHVVSHILAN